MKDKYLPYFYRIKKFINDPKNKKYSKLYNKTADELNTKIVIHRKKCEFFEEILEKIYNYIIESSRNSVLSEKRDVFWIFLNFMYWNCDVGDKYDKTT